MILLAVTLSLSDWGALLVLLVLLGLLVCVDCGESLLGRAAEQTDLVGHKVPEELPEFQRPPDEWRLL